MKRKILCALALIGAMSTQTFADNTMTVAIDGNNIADSSAVVENGVTYISVRPVAEALGLNVDWASDTKTVTVSNNGPLYITFTIGENAYTFAKTAPMELSGAPVIIDSASYIPADVVTDLLNYEIVEEDNVLNIVTGADVSVEDDTASGEAVENENTENENTSEDAVISEQNEGTGTVKEVSDTEILFEDEAMGEVRLNKSDNVKVTDEDGNAVDIDSIEEGTKLIVEYGDVMTKSLPPLNNPVSITVCKADEEKVTGTGVVAEVSEDEILFDDDVKGEVRLNKSDNVKVTDEDGNAVDINSIEVGANLTVEYGKAMTMSIPPLNNPVSITVLK